MKLWMTALTAALVLGTAGFSMAHSPCCSTYDPCTGDQYVVKGDTPDASECCEDTVDGEGNPVTVCEAAPNAGYRCSEDVAANAQAIPDRSAVAGCVNAEEACIGGAIDGTGANGCAWMSGAGGVVDGAPVTDDGEGSAGWNGCIENAVANCCRLGACE